MSSGVEIRYGVLGSPVPPEYLAKAGIARIQMSNNARSVDFFIFPPFNKKVFNYQAVTGRGLCDKKAIDGVIIS
jgi:hypothetical protein